MAASICWHPSKTNIISFPAKCISCILSILISGVWYQNCLYYQSPMYYIIFCFFYLLSLLPMRLLYFISDGIYLVVYYMIGYRKKTVMENLGIAFPEMSMTERVKIAKAFYHNLIDSFIETIKLVSASRRFLEKRITANWEVIDPLYKSGKSCQLHLGHTFNWEWGHHVLGNHTKYQ